MIIQKKTARRKLHSIQAIPAGKDFAGTIELGRTKYNFAFSPRSAEMTGGKLVLKGSVTVRPGAGGARRTVDDVTATMLSTQGNIHPGPGEPRALPASLKPNVPAQRDLPITDASYHLSSVGVIYFKLSPLDGKTLGVPMDLSDVQLNARLYPTSETERDLQWLYSAYVLNPSEQGLLNEINKILKS